MIEDSGGGLCVAPGDAAALAGALAALEADPSLARTLGEAGRQYVEAHVARRSATALYGRLIERLVGARRPGLQRIMSAEEPMP
jgi:glycosyltransferase involved in cell wall biosynthesis